MAESKTKSILDLPLDEAAEAAADAEIEASNLILIQAPQFTRGLGMKATTNNGCSTRRVVTSSPTVPTAAVGMAPTRWLA